MRTLRSVLRTSMHRMVHRFGFRLVRIHPFERAILVELQSSCIDVLRSVYADREHIHIVRAVNRGDTFAELRTTPHRRS